MCREFRAAATIETLAPGGESLPVALADLPIMAESDDGTTRQRLRTVIRAGYELFGLVESSASDGSSRDSSYALTRLSLGGEDGQASAVGAIGDNGVALPVGREMLNKQGERDVEADMSRTHFSVRIRNGRFSVEDLHSSNGTEILTGRAKQGRVHESKLTRGALGMVKRWRSGQQAASEPWSDSHVWAEEGLDDELVGQWVSNADDIVSFNTPSYAINRGNGTETVAVHDVLNRRGTDADGRRTLTPIVEIRHPNGIIEVVRAKDFLKWTGTKNGDLHAVLRGSQKPQTAARPEAAVKVDYADYAHALAMHPDELWAERDNGGRPQDPDYIRNYGAVREYLVGAFREGTLYSSPETFASYLKLAHGFLGKSGDYNRLSAQKLDPNEYGEFQAPGRSSNSRLSQSRWASEIAAMFGDAYGANGRFESGQPNSQDVWQLELPGISRDNIPYDVVRYDGKGNLKSLNHKKYVNNGYEYVYPDSAGAGEYMQQMQQLGRTIETATKEGGMNFDDVLALVAKQYQYGVSARPFKQINNSLFMQLANAQVKMLGFGGLTHGHMDIAAQRMRPDAFARYFTARVKQLIP